MNLITPVFHEKNFFDEKGTLHQEKQIIKGRFIYIIDKFTKDKPDSVSEYYANSKGNFADGIIQSTTGQSFQLNKENIIFMLQIIIFLYLKMKEKK